MWLSESSVMLIRTLWGKTASQFPHLDPEEGQEPAGTYSLSNPPFCRSATKARKTGVSQPDSRY